MFVMQSKEDWDENQSYEKEMELISMFGMAQESGCNSERDLACAFSDKVLSFCFFSRLCVLVHYFTDAQGRSRIKLHVVHNNLKNLFKEV